MAEEVVAMPKVARVIACVVGPVLIGTVAPAAGLRFADPDPNHGPGPGPDPGCGSARTPTSRSREGARPRARPR